MRYTIEQVMDRLEIEDLITDPPAVDGELVVAEAGDRHAGARHGLADVDLAAEERGGAQTRQQLWCKRSRAGCAQRLVARTRTPRPGPCVAGGAQALEADRDGVHARVVRRHGPRQGPRGVRLVPEALSRREAVPEGPGGARARCGPGDPIRPAGALPGLHDAQLLGVPVPIWLVVVPPFPLFFFIGLLEQRRADALDEAFRDLVE